MAKKRVWYKAAERDALADGRVMSVTCGRETVCLVRYRGQWAALDNRCPHQGGPLGEGAIENGMLRCPWHGWDFDPLTGKPPGGYDDGVPTFPIEVRDDGVYVGVEEDDERVRTAADVIAETLVAWGVDTAFGMVGHSNLGMADALRCRQEAGELRYYGIRHEGAAAFAASAYGKLTGRPAACLTIAGPGATNLLTGLWDARVDGAPVVALTGQVPTPLIGRGAFQEVDLVDAFGQVAVWRAQAAADSDVAELATLACKHAIVAGGPAHLVLPDDVQVVPRPDAPAGSPTGRIGSRAIAPPADAVDASVALLRKARRPVIVAGHGARFAMQEVIALAEQLRCPVVTTFKAKGQIPDSHPCGCGVLGRSGTPVASWFMNESDLLVVLGASFSNHTGITPKKPTIQVDRDPLRLGRFHPVDVPVWGDVAATVAAWRDAIGGAVDTVDQRPEIAARWAIWRREKSARLAEERGAGVSSAAVFAALTRTAPADAIVAVDVGNNAYSFGRYFECERQSVVLSGYLGSIGFAYPAALGAWAATRGRDPRFAGRKVIAVAGDGGFGQYMGELNTAVKYGMDIALVLLNNGELGKISKEQRAGHWPVWETGLTNPSFARYAEDCGARAARVSRAGELDAALADAIEATGPAVVDIAADPLLV
ncbi:MAG: thiamine pyrophosphate-binding protein [Deltaproteobacteria bacterium]|nr:MAG: thiamine pyrophosphate-binding protein [Deltaproteobacteria bacterium]